MRGALLLVLAGCGDNQVVPADAVVPCVARFSGNFTETSTADACASIAPAGFSLTMPATTLDGALVATIDLGPSPSPGAYSPATVATWSVQASQAVFGGTCTYSAGTASVPPGTFALALATLEPLHGTLDVTQYILGFPPCGDRDTESVAISF